MNSAKEATSLDHQLSVIVPIGPGEKSWTHLATDLCHLPMGSEILLVGPRPPAGRVPKSARILTCGRRWGWIASPLGRAVQMNIAAKAAAGPFLWFLHADSRLAENSLRALTISIREAPNALHYFDLRFDDHGPRLMKINEWGARFRSRRLGLPFGDQGFVLGKDIFLKLGGYREDVSYGEDHLLVWQAARHGVQVRCTGASLFTSPRKYQENGWFSTTLRHQFRTFKQALPEYWRARRRVRAGDSGGHLV